MPSFYFGPVEPFASPGYLFIHLAQIFLLQHNVALPFVNLCRSSAAFQLYSIAGFAFAVHVSYHTLELPRNSNLEPDCAIFVTLPMALDSPMELESTSLSWSNIFRP